MAMQVKPDMVEVGVKQRYRVTNWSEYDRALVNRGNLTIWFDDASIRDQWTPPPPEGRGKPGLYSATAIQTCLTIKALFQLPYGAAKGLVKPLIHRCQLDLPAPDHTHISPRAAQLALKIPQRPHKGATHRVVDSTALKDLRPRRLGESGVSGSIASHCCSGSAVQSRPWNGSPARGKQVVHLAQSPSARRRNQRGQHWNASHLHHRLGRQRSLARPARPSSRGRSRKSLRTARRSPGPTTWRWCWSLISS